MNSGYDPRHAGDPRHGNQPEPQPEPEDLNAGWVQPPEGMPDPAALPYSPGWSGAPPQPYGAQPYEPPASPYAPSAYALPPNAQSPYAPQPYPPQPADQSPYAPVPYNQSPYGTSPNSSQPSRPAPYRPSAYAPEPYAQRPTAASPYATPAYAPAAYAAASGRTAWDADVKDSKGKPMLTPFRVVTFIALVVSASVAAYSLLIARGSQVIPVTVAALAVFAVSAALLGINIGAGAMGSARDGHLGRSVGGALVGGILCLAAAGGASAAIILGMLAKS